MLGISTSLIYEHLFIDSSRLRLCRDARGMAREDLFSAHQKKSNRNRMVLLVLLCLLEKVFEIFQAFVKGEKKSPCLVDLVLPWDRLSWCPQGEKPYGKEGAWTWGHKERVETLRKRRKTLKNELLVSACKVGQCKQEKEERRRGTEETSAALSACFWFAQDETEVALTLRGSCFTQKHPSHQESSAFVLQHQDLPKHPPHLRPSRLSLNPLMLPIPPQLWNILEALLLVAKVIQDTETFPNSDGKRAGLIS